MYAAKSSALNDLGESTDDLKSHSLSPSGIGPDWEIGFFTAKDQAAGASRTVPLKDPSKYILTTPSSIDFDEAGSLQLRS